MGYDALGRLLSRSNFTSSATWPNPYAGYAYSAEFFSYSANIPGPTGRQSLGNSDPFAPKPPYTSYAYDLFNRKTNEICYDQLDGTALMTNSFSFSGAGALLTLTDGKMQTTIWKYDQYGH